MRFSLMWRVLAQCDAQDIKNSAAAKAVARITMMKQETAAADKEVLRQAAEMAKMSQEAIRSMNMERIQGMKAAELGALSRHQVRTVGSCSQLCKNYKPIYLGLAERW
jgi:hypothetical protein